MSDQHQHQHQHQLLFTAYDKGENDLEMTVKELVQYLSVELKPLLESSYQKSNF